MHRDRATHERTLPVWEFTRLLLGLKLRLLQRHYQRQTASAWAELIGLALAILTVVVVLVGIGAYLRFGGEAQRTACLFWTLWVATLAWALAPLGQLDLQRNIDLNALRTLPVSRPRFSLAALLDAALSPLGLVSLLGGVLACGVFALHPTEVPALATALLLLGLFHLGVGQTVYLLFNRIVASRRFADLSMLLGLLSLLALQALNLLLQNDVAIPSWLAAAAAWLRALLLPLGQALAPGLAARAVAAAGQGWLLQAATLYGWLALQAVGALACARWAAQKFYEGEAESGGRGRLLSSTSSVGMGLMRPAAKPMAALLWRERAYLWRDPLVKMQIVQSLFGSLYLAAVIVFMSFRHGDAYFVSRLAEYGKYLLLGLALMLGLAESAVLFNRFGYEGGQVANLLITPVSRRTLLASKSLHLVAHFLPLNVTMVLIAAAALEAPPLYWALAALLVATNTLLLDAIGQYVSIYLPFAYRRVGRRVRAVMPQPGCGYVLIYVTVFQLCHLLTMPISAVSIALALLGGWQGFAVAVLWSGGVGWLAYHVSQPDAAYRLLQRELQLMTALTKTAD